MIKAIQKTQDVLKTAMIILVGVVVIVIEFWVARN